MKKIDFIDKSDEDLLDLQKVIQLLINNEYSMKKILKILQLSKEQFNKIFEFQYKTPLMNNVKIDYQITEKEMMEDSTIYCYDNLSESEKIIYNNVTNYDKWTRKFHF